MRALSQIIRSNRELERMRENFDQALPALPSHEPVSEDAAHEGRQANEQAARHGDAELGITFG